MCACYQLASNTLDGHSKLHIRHKKSKYIHLKNYKLLQN
jgi:hypothetical protein